MPALKFDTVTGANVYDDTNSLYGRAQEISGLSVNMIEKDINPIGMYGKKKVPVGIDSLEVDITWDFLNEKFLNPFAKRNLTIYGNVVRTEDGSERELAVKMELTGRIQENDIMGTVKGQDWSGQKVKFTLDRIKVWHDGSEVIEIDVDNNIFKTDGVDRLEEMRKNANL